MVELFKAENESVGKVRLVCHDGSIVTIIVKDKPVKAARKER